MTPATLRTLREALSFTVEGLAQVLGVNRRTLVRWESVNSIDPVPEDVARRVVELIEWVEDTVEAALEAIETQDPPEGTAIDLYRYVSADSAYRAGLEVPWPVHNAAMGRLASELLVLGYVPFVHYIPIEE